MEPVRITFWNTPHWLKYVHYILSLVAVIIFLYGLSRRWHIWRLGLEDDRTDDFWTRVKGVLQYAVVQVKVVREVYPGLMHLGIFWGMVFLFIGTGLVFFQDDIFRPLFGLEYMRGTFYLIFEIVLDIFGLFLLIGLLMAAYRRFVIKPDRLDNLREDPYTLSLLFVTGLTGFLMEAVRLATTRPAWAGWSPMGHLLSVLFGSPTEAGVATLYGVLWFTHSTLALVFIAVLPYTKLFHIITTPLNIFFRSLKPAGELKPIEDIEETEILGVSKATEFTWKQRLDFDACTRCGRCQDACPAYAVNTPLSPKKLILNLKDHMLATAVVADGEEPPALHGQTVTTDELWACTTCRSCMEQCPALIEHVDTIVDLRRYLALQEGAFPHVVGKSLTNINWAGNPWGMARGERLDWKEELEVPVFSSVGEAEYLYWPGCCGAYSTPNQDVARSMVRLMQAAGVDFAVLGTEETCCGEPARRLGEEYLYQTLVQANVQAMSQYKFQKIVTECPHCLTTLQHEYPQFGGHYEVIHHTTLLNELIAAGRLKPVKPLDKTIAYHDPCYLGRYSGVYDLPRELLQRIPGVKLVEMEQSRAKSFCCGGGGGGMWMEYEPEQRINLRRMDQIAAVKPDVAALACPFCHEMLEDAAKMRGLEETMGVQDIAQLIEAAL